MVEITIITATRNNHETIIRLAKSLRSQRYSNFEWIVQDSCSTDETVALAKKYFPALQVISERDTSVYDAWNRAVGRSKGKFVIFLGADDFLLNEDVLHAVSRNLISDQVIYYGGMYLLNEQNLELYGYRNVGAEDYKSTLDLPIHAFPPAPATFFPGDALRARRFVIEFKFHADADMYYQLAKAGIEIENLNIDVAAMGDGGMTSAVTGRLDRQTEKFAIWKKYKQDFKILNLREISFRTAFLQLAKDTVKSLWHR